MPPIAEQLADRITGGQLTETRTALQTVTGQYREMYSEHRKLSREIQTLKEGGVLSEGYADQSWHSRLALDGRWQLLSGQATHRVIQKSEVDLYHDLMSYAYTFCPLIKAAVDIKTRYTWGLGYMVEGTTDAAKSIIAAVMDDPTNRYSIFGAQALAEADRELQRGGNIYLAIYTDDDPVRVRLWTSYEINDVIMKPGDSIPWYYVRSWTDESGVRQTRAYPSIFNTYPGASIDGRGLGYTVDKTVVVYQMSEGRGPRQKWALSPFTSALPWNRAYEQFLLDFAAIVQIIRKYSTMFTTTGGESQVSSLQTAFANEQRGDRKNEVGNGLVATEGNDFKVIDAGNSKIVGPQDSRYFLLQVCASTGVPENMITGNLQTGNRASAQEMTSNFLPIIEERQTAWADSLKDVFTYILGTPDLSVSFPPIRAQDSLTYLQTLLQAATLGNPGKLAGTMRPEDVIRAIYEGLDIRVPEDEDIDELVVGILDVMATDPEATGALDRLTRATNFMNDEARKLQETLK